MSVVTLLIISVVTGAGAGSFAEAQEEQTARSVRTAAARLAPQQQAPELLIRSAWLGLDAVARAVPLASPSRAPISGSALASAREEAPVQGTLTGQVVAAGTLRSLVAAQVFIVGTGIGRLTNANGRYLLINVPDGSHTLRVELIGYATGEQQVTITSGTTTTVDFQLEEEALALDEIVVTGTAGQARRREVGNTVAQINTSTILEPLSSVDALLQARVPGILVAGQSGNSGSGAMIRLRGNVSVALSNQPLIYVDGVRIKSEPYPLGGSSRQDRPATTGSPLNDINPADIDRVEIIKGAAATTLYGTEAAAGVIQIFTKQGGTGSAVWTAQIDEGFNYFRPWGPPEEPFMFHKPVLRNGLHQRYSASVRGGRDELGYFLSFAGTDSKGGIETDQEQNWSVRGNTTFRPHEDVLIQFNNAYVSQEVVNTRQGNNVTGTVMVTNQEYWGPTSRDPETIRTMLARSAPRTLNRLTTGLTVHYDPTPNLTNRVTVGADWSDWRGLSEIPFGWRFADAEKGRRARQISRTMVTSLDYVSSLRVDLAPEWRSTLSVGAQAVESEESYIEAEGFDFPGPGEFTVSSTARSSADERSLRVITGGLFLQGLLDFRDRYFLTLGLRVDGNSAFGESFGLQPYPKVSFSHVLSDEAFWPDDWGEVKLRVAYGHAGRAPGAFDAVRTWDPVGYGLNRPALLPENLGNPDLGPERTAEIELGFDASFLNGRLRLDYTYYNQKTTDALFRVQGPLSEGNWSPQLQNVGELANWGHELAINATVLDRRSLRWDVGLNASTNHSKVISLGGAPRFAPASTVRYQAWIEEGQPVPVIRTQWVTNFWEKAKPIYEDDKIMGPHWPTLSLSPSMSFTLPGGIRLSARGEYQGGFWINNLQETAALGRSLDLPICWPAFRKRDEGRLDDVYAWEWSKCLEAGVYGRYVNPGDYFELRDLTVAVPVSRWVPGSSQATLTASSHNLWYWTKSELMLGHPEGLEVQIDGQSPLVRQLGEQLPPLSRFIVSLRVVF